MAKVKKLVRPPPPPAKPAPVEAEAGFFWADRQPFGGGQVKRFPGVGWGIVHDPDDRR